MTRQHRVGVILSGGRSSRMGSPKALLRDAEGRTLLERGVRSLRAAGVRDILVVTGFHPAAIAQEARRLGATPVHNRLFDRGQWSSVRRGLRAALGRDADRVVLGPVDLPGASREALRAVLSSGAEVVIPCYRGARGIRSLYRPWLRPGSWPTGHRPTSGRRWRSRASRPRRWRCATRRSWPSSTPPASLADGSRAAHAAPRNLRWWGRAVGAVTHEHRVGAGPRARDRSVQPARVLRGPGSLADALERGGRRAPRDAAGPDPAGRGLLQAAGGRALGHRQAPRASAGSARRRRDLAEGMGIKIAPLLESSRLWLEQARRLVREQRSAYDPASLPRIHSRHLDA